MFDRLALQSDGIQQKCYVCMRMCDCDVPYRIKCDNDCAKRILKLRSIRSKADNIYTVERESLHNI